ncbi:MAG: metallophosphoesterase [Peptococcaceae bacterium]|nr:metallophosphoesterase [Peptococcaceae bacterium]
MKNYPEKSQPLSRRTFLRRLLGFVAAHRFLTAIPVSGFGLTGWVSHDTLALRLYDWNLYYPHLPDELEGKTILQLSDLHLHHLKISAARIAAALHAQQPDVLVFTGDLVSSRSDLDQISPYLTAFRCAPYCFLVLGNHDYLYFSQALRSRYMELAQDSGWRALINQSEFIADLNLWIIGIDDPSTAHDDVKLAYAPLLQSPPEPFRLALAHSTDCLDAVAGYGADLLLTGHTHGGQIRLPGLGPFITNTYLGDKGIYEGYHVVSGIPLYINRGIGCSRLPFRLGVLPEITKFTLRRGAQDPTCSIQALP